MNTKNWNEEKLNKMDIVNNILLIEELQILKKRKLLSNLSNKEFKNITSRIVDYLSLTFFRHEITENEKHWNIAMMRCVYHLYLLIIKIGKQDIELTVDIPNKLNIAHHLSPVKINFDFRISNNIKYILNLYIVEDYMRKIIHRMYLSLFDVIGITKYISRLLKCEQHITELCENEYFTYIIPSLAILYSKACGDDDIEFNDIHTQKILLYKPTLNKYEIQLLKNIKLFIDDSIYFTGLVKYQLEITLC